MQKLIEQTQMKIDALNKNSRHYLQMLRILTNSLLAYVAAVNVRDLVSSLYAS